MRNENIFSFYVFCFSWTIIHYFLYFVLENKYFNNFNFDCRLIGNNNNNIPNLRPNLKSLSRGLNLRHGSNMVGFIENCIQCFKI